jgi:hypothetical protein
MEVFKVVYETENDGDLYGISIVNDPANGFDFIAMSKKMEIKLATDQKKKILYGIVLRPEQKIYREFEDGTPFQLMFDGPTIERFSQDFMTKGYQKNTTFNHDGGNLGGTTVVENWIVMDKTNDKGNSIGLPVENGDWVIGMKLSDQLWSEYIETGKATGFSIDSFVQFEKINMKSISRDCLMDNSELNSRENNKKKNMSGILKKLIKLFSEGEVKLASLEVEGLGVITSDAFEVGNIVYYEDLQPVVSKEFIVDNKVYQTDETGAIVEISDVTEESTEEVAEEEVAEEVALEDVAAEVVTDVEGVTGAINEEVAKQVEDIDIEALKVLVSQLQADLEKLTQQQEAVLLENVELKNMAASTKLKAEVKVGTNNPINLKSKELSTEDTLSALSRIVKKNKK